MADQADTDAAVAGSNAKARAGSSAAPPVAKPSLWRRITRRGAAGKRGNDIPAAAFVAAWLIVVTIAAISFGTAVFNQLDNFPDDASTANLEAWVFWGLEVSIPDASRQLFVVALAAASGVIGGLIYTSRALAYHYADENFDARWVPWYFVRILVAGLLGALVILAIAAGLITGGTGSDTIEPSGVVALAFVTGLASKRALEKFQDLIEVIFGNSSGNVDSQAAQIARIRKMAADNEITAADADGLVALVGEA